MAPKNNAAAADKKKSDKKRSDKKAKSDKSDAAAGAGAGATDKKKEAEKKAAKEAAKAEKEAAQYAADLEKANTLMDDALTNAWYRKRRVARRLATYEALAEAYKNEKTLIDNEYAAAEKLAKAAKGDVAKLKAAKEKADCVGVWDAEAEKNILQKLYTDTKAVEDAAVAELKRQQGGQK